MKTTQIDDRVRAGGIDPVGAAAYDGQAGFDLPRDGNTTSDAR